MRPPYARTPKPTPQQGHESLKRTKDLALRLAELVDKVLEAKDELHETAHWGATSNGSVTPGRSVSKDSDPTGTIAVSVPHRYLRRQLLLAEKAITRVDVKPLERAITDVERLVKDAVRFAWDSELREQIERADEADRDYRSRRRGRTA